MAPTDLISPQNPSGQATRTFEKKSHPVLEAINVQRILGAGETATHILTGVNLSVEHGTYCSIVGSSGSGKSTLLYLLGGLDRPSMFDLDEKPFDPPCQILVDGKCTNDLDDTELALLRNEKVGFVFQFHYLLREFSALENVTLPMLKANRLGKKQINDRASHLLDRLGMGSKLHRPANKLSGGEQQRVAIARALSNEPVVLLADEPTGNLDRHNGELVAEIFRELASGGQTIVMVTHDTALAAQARRRITMQDGQILHDMADDAANAI